MDNSWTNKGKEEAKTADEDRKEVRMDKWTDKNVKNKEEANVWINND